MPNNFASVIDAKELKILSSELDASEFDNVASGERLAAGPIPLRRGPVRIAKAPAGTTLLIYQGGRRVETLRNRSVHTLTFPPGNRLEQYIVDMRQRTLALESRDELYTRRQDNLGNVHHITVSVTMHVGYEVSDPVFIVERGDRQPLTTLLTRTVEAARKAIDGMDYYTFMHKGELGDPILNYLQEWERKSPIGFQINSVSIRDINPNSVIEEIDWNIVEEDARIAHTGRVKDETRRQEKLDIIASTEQTAVSNTGKREQRLLDAESEVQRTSIIKKASREQEHLDAQLATRIADLSGIDIKYVRGFLDRDVLAAILDGEQQAIRHQAEILEALAKNPTIGTLAASSSFPELANLFKMSTPTSNSKDHPRSDGTAAPEQDPAPDANTSNNTQWLQDLGEMRLDPDLDVTVIGEQTDLCVRVCQVKTDHQKIEIWLQGSADYPDSAPEVDVQVDGSDFSTSDIWTSETRLIDFVRNAIRSTEKGR